MTRRRCRAVLIAKLVLLDLHVVRLHLPLRLVLVILHLWIREASSHSLRLPLAHRCATLVVVSAVVASLVELVKL